MPLNRHDSFGYLTNYLARLFSRALDARLNAHGVAVGQFGILLLLWEQDGLTQSELGKRAAVEQSTVANTLARMERDGLIRRQSAPQDRRSAFIYLTRRARELETPLTLAALAVLDQAAQGLTADEKQSLLNGLRRMIANLSAPPPA